MISDIDYDEPPLFRCVGGPWADQSILLGGDEATMVFATKPLRKVWRGRYITRKPGDRRLPYRDPDNESPRICRWEDVPLN